ncbi:MAG: alpha/beta fold hydrolase, partial [Gemmatimonadales bacterium]
PTLYTVGEFDEADPPTIRRFAAMTPGARVEVLAGAAHVTSWDAPGPMVRVIRDFLHRVEATRSSKPSSP